MFFVWFCLVFFGFVVGGFGGLFVLVGVCVCVFVVLLKHTQHKKKKPPPPPTPLSYVFFFFFSPVQLFSQPVALQPLTRDFARSSITNARHWQFTALPLAFESHDVPIPGETNTMLAASLSTMTHPIVIV